MPDKMNYDDADGGDDGDDDDDDDDDLMVVVMIKLHLPSIQVKN